MLKTLAFLIPIIISIHALAGEQRVRIGADAGVGVAIVEVSGSRRSEEPATFAFMVDYAWSSNFVLGVEHYRTIVNDNGPSSGVGFTGMYAKYYFSSMKAQTFPSEEVISQDEYFVKALSPYIGASFGIGQASLRALEASQGGNRSLSVGGYIGGKLGLEYPLGKSLTLFTEFNVAQTIMGTGTILFPRASIGILFSL